MKKIISLIVMTMSFPAFSAVYEVNFIGTITSTTGFGAGYSVGDTISSSLQVDASRAIMEWTTWGNTDGFISSDFARPTAINNAGHLSYDSILVANDVLYQDLPDGGFSEYDEFYLYESESEYNSPGSSTTWKFREGIQLYVQSYAVEFLSDVWGAELDQDFDLQSGNGVWMSGSVWFYDDLNPNPQNGSAEFSITSLSYHEVTTVPLPMAGHLFLLGFVALFAGKQARGEKGRSL